MSAVEVKITRLPHGAGLPLPAYQSEQAAGLDLLAAVPADAPVSIKPGERALIPTGKCQVVVPCVPVRCRRCGRPLAGADSEPLRHQVWEFPDITPVVTEYQQHRLVCSCSCSTCGPLPSGVPTGQAGPRLIAFSISLRR